MNKIGFNMLLAGLAVLFLLPAAASAATATLDSITPTATDITDLGGGQSDLPDGVVLKVFNGTLGTNYTAVFSVDVEPAMVVITGASMGAAGWSYDALTDKVTVNVKHTGYASGISFPSPPGMEMNPFGIAIVWPETATVDGPPDEMTGGWMSVNLQTWNLIPPTDAKPHFGYDLSGPDGSTGKFKMFIPDETLTLLSELAEDTFEFADLAVFMGTNPVSIKITEVAGGALVDISVTFKDNTNIVTASSFGTAYTSDVTKKVTIREKLPISLSAKKTRLKIGKRTKLFGWLKSGRKDKKIILSKKVKGKTSFKRIKATRTNKNGFFKFYVSPKKTTVFKVKIYKKPRVKRKKITVFK